MVFQWRCEIIDGLLMFFDILKTPHVDDMLMVSVSCAISQTRWNACYAARLVLRCKQVTSSNPIELVSLYSVIQCCMFIPRRL